MQCKATYFEHVNNLNHNYNNLQCAYDQLTQYQASMYSEPVVPVKRDMMVEWNPIIQLWRHLLNNTMKIQEIVTNSSILVSIELFGDATNMKQCDVLKFDLDSNAYFYSNNKPRDDFVSSITAASFEDDSITLHVCEARVEYLQDAAVIFHALFTNSTEYLSENEIKSAYYDDFDTMIVTLALMDLNMFFLRLNS